MKVLNFGSLNIDFVYQVEHFVQDGETISSLRMDKNVGGKGLNQSIALSRAGLDVYHAGCIGEDGAFLKEYLTGNGVNTDNVQVVSDATGHAIIQVNRDGQNCILLYGGANQRITKEHVDEVLAKFGAGDWLVLQNEINEMAYIIEQAHAKGMVIVLNPSPINAAIATLPMEKVDWFFVNETEGAFLSEEKETDKIVAALRVKYPSSKFVLTLGPQGAAYFDQKDYILVPAVDVPVVDTTAAGDTFTGFFVREITEGGTPKRALDIASLASAHAVSIAGAACSIPYYSEIVK